jgi:hypothetical protein
VGKGKIMNLPQDKFGLTLDHNPHKAVYDTIVDWIGESDGHATWESEEMKQKAIEDDNVWTLVWYPDTTLSFFFIAAPTLEDLLRYANED